jgi:hypothetical protein
MEPTEPIRGRKEDDLCTDRLPSGLCQRLFSSSVDFAGRFLTLLGLAVVVCWKPVLLWCLDFVACSVALIGLAVTAGWIASFNSKVHWSFAPRKSDDAEVLERLMAIVVVLLLSVSGVCFTYMLWRCHWQYRLSTWFKMALFLALVFSAVLADTDFAIYDCAAMIITCALIWSFRRKDVPE